MRFHMTSVVAALLAGASIAPTAHAKTSENAVEAVVVTGRRGPAVEALKSATPVSVVTAQALERAGSASLLSALERLTPSLNLPGMTGGDLSNLVHTARLRGLSPNHTLVLVNGRRRHGSSIVNATPGPAQGSSPADLDLIPLSAIDHIEILQDGASAQYGSDAIAGVINIILKSRREGGEAALGAGAHYEGDGETIEAGASLGVSLPRQGALTLSASYRRHEATDRTGADTRAGVPSPDVGKIMGDPASTVSSVLANAVLPLGALEVYGVASYGHRKASSYQNYRLASDIPAPYFGKVFPQGYIPRETIDEDDGSATVGLRGGAADGWRWDLATSFGIDRAKIGVKDSINLSLLTDTGSSPTRFDAGAFRASQWTTNLDVTRAIEAGLAAPIQLAFGLEHRRDGYRLSPGDAASRYKEGSVAFPGYSLTDAGSHHRQSVAAYLDLTLQPIEPLTLEAAGRYEHFDDFGGSTTGKASLRYELTPGLALRASVGRGFAAPTLQQQHFSATNVGLSQALIQLPANSAAARIVGAKALRPETSANASLGLVARLSNAASLTIDAYQVDIDNRILNTGYLYGAQADAAIAAHGAVVGKGVFAVVSFFNNAIDTRTRGVDIAADYRTDLGAAGQIAWRLAGSFNRNSIRHIDPAQAGALTSLFDPPSINALTTVAPRSKVSLSAVDAIGRWTLSLRATRYGETHLINSPSFVFPPFYDNKTGPKVITDLEVALAATQATTIALGANNLFDIYPTKTIPASRDRNTMVYPYLSPFGFNGGYYYARLAVRF